jgi:hypothetical protein
MPFDGKRMIYGGFQVAVDVLSTAPSANTEGPGARAVDSVATRGLRESEPFGPADPLISAADVCLPSADYHRRLPVLWCPQLRRSRSAVQVAAAVSGRTG